MTKKKELIWVYPPNNWISNYNKTFVYGWSNPKAKLFVSVETLHVTSLQRVKIFPNGNFAQTIKLPKKKNIVKLIQIFNSKKKIVSRNVVFASLRGAQRRSNLPGMKRFVRLPRRHFSTQADPSSGGVPPRNDKGLVIIIDPGHGGKEHGTHSPKGIPEKVFNLQIAKSLYKNLNSVEVGLKPTSTRRVYLTRSNDKFVSLKQRVDFAKKKKCNILISIHHNALPDNEDPLKHKGVGVYYTHDFVKPLATSLLKSISKEAKLKQHGIFKRDFAVTRPDFYTGVLIECGFLIHPTESEYIMKREVQKKIVSGIVKELTTLI